MTSSPTPVRAESPRGIRTNGEGKATTAHLNLERTLADAKEPRNRYADAKTIQRAEKRAMRRRERQSDYKIKYAGAEA